MNWLLPLAAGGLLLVFVVGRGMSLRRTRELRAWAEERGLEFMPGCDRHIGITFLEVPLVGNGRAGARNHATGEWQGRRVHAFDLVVGPDADDGVQGTSRHTCVLVKADLPLIPLCIRPRSGDGMPSAGLDDWPVVSVSASFDAAFHAASPDPGWARDLLHPQAIAGLLAQPGWRLDLGGWYCLVAAPGRLGADRLDEALTVARSFLDAIPETARREILGASPPGPSNAD